MSDKEWEETTYPFPNSNCANGDEWFNYTVYNVCKWLSMSVRKFNHVSKKVPEVSLCERLLKENCLKFSFISNWILFYNDYNIFYLLPVIPLLFIRHFSMVERNKKDACDCNLKMIWMYSRQVTNLKLLIFNAKIQNYFPKVALN